MKTDMSDDCKRAFEEFWRELSRKGDPLRIPNPFSISFKAGWEAAMTTGAPKPQ